MAPSLHLVKERCNLSKIHGTDVSITFSAASPSSVTVLICPIQAHQQQKEKDGKQRCPLRKHWGTGVDPSQRQGSHGISCSALKALPLHVSLVSYISVLVATGSATAHLSLDSWFASNQQTPWSSYKLKIKVLHSFHPALKTIRQTLLFQFYFHSFKTS